MSAQTGLTGVEVAVLEAVDAEAAGAGDSFCGTTLVLDRLDESFGLGPRYAQPLLADLIAPWVRHLPLLEGQGNWGSIGGDSPADARYTQVWLSPVGRLALKSERGAVGPLPLGLIEGTMYRGGNIPPFDPALVVAGLMTNAGSAGPPRMPTGTVTGPFLAGATAGGEPVWRLRLGAAIHSEQRGARYAPALVITGPPYGIGLDQVAASILGRVGQEARQADSDEPWSPEVMGMPPDVGPPPYVPPPAPVVDVEDHTSGRWGPRVVCRLRQGADVVDALDWLRDIWPVTFEVDCLPYEELFDRFGTWDRADLTGLRALEGLITPPRSGDDAP